MQGHGALELALREDAGRQNAERGKRGDAHETAGHGWLTMKVMMNAMLRTYAVKWSGVSEGDRRSGQRGSSGPPPATEHPRRHQRDHQANGQRLDESDRHVEKRILIEGRELPHLGQLRVDDFLAPPARLRLLDH